jgi:uncharacterized membrane protein
MASKNLLGILVAAFMLVAFASSAAAFGSIASVEVNGVQTTDGMDFANFVGQKVPILVTFTATNPASDVRVKAWFSGESQNAASSQRFDVLAGKLYTSTVYLDVPSNLRDTLSQNRKLYIAVENQDETADEVVINFTVQRESYQLDILNVDMQSEARAGESVPVDVVLKNIGSHLADDTFLRIRVPELGIDTNVYFGDLSAIDDADNDRTDSVERRAYIRVPVNAPAGLYTVQLEASNSDSVVKAEKRLVVSGASEDGALIVPSQTSKAFSVGETAEYKLTLVNRGSVIAVYQLTATAPQGLNVQISDPIVVVPAGSSRTVTITADASARDDYTFVVKVNSESGAPISQQTFVANVAEGTGKGITGTTTSNATILLTVILAIIFIVLLVVLIVLLTRKPETKEEFGESYY